jgi:hypothetical protein
MALLYGRARRLTAQNGGFRPGQFIDDVFSWMLEMPTRHRIACLRDDVVFFIFLYQRYLYPVDKTRANEFGRAYAREDEAEGEPEPESAEAEVGASGGGGGDGHPAAIVDR